ncbi:unnamed protein product, partial [Nesidiocoris tenuis]
MRLLIGWHSTSLENLRWWLIGARGPLVLVGAVSHCILTGNKNSLTRTASRPDQINASFTPVKPA